jgi:serine protease DegS
VVRGWIGIVPEDVSDEQARELRLEHGGVVVANLYVGSPALQRGMQLGDLITDIDGTKVRSAQEAVARIATRKPGETISIRGRRGNRAFETRIPVTEKPRNR